MKKILIILGIILGIILMLVGSFIGINNTAINLEEQIKESKSSINIQEKRREDLIYNLVDTVESYNKYEQDTMSKIIEARTKAGNGKVEEAEILINAHRNNYNIQVKQYNKHIKNFPNNLILNIMGYEKLDNTYLKYNTSEDAPRNLFGE